MPVGWWNFSLGPAPACGLDTDPSRALCLEVDPGRALRLAAARLSNWRVGSQAEKSFQPELELTPSGVLRGPLANLEAL